MATPQYPSTLPGPRSVQLTASESRLSSSESDPYQTRLRTLVAGATVSVSFKFLRSQYKGFVQWYRDDLMFGHKWFELDLSMSGDPILHIVRFVEQPQTTSPSYNHREVTGTLEIRARL